MEEEKMTTQEAINQLNKMAVTDRDYEAVNIVTDSIMHGRWISVKDRLPEEGIRALTLDKYGNIGVRALKRFAGEENPLFRPDGLAPGKHITHWMPLPQPPKEE